MKIAVGASSEARIRLRVRVSNTRAGPSAAAAVGCWRVVQGSRTEKYKLEKIDAEKSEGPGRHGACVGRLAVSATHLHTRCAPQVLSGKVLVGHTLHAAHACVFLSHGPTHPKCVEASFLG